jgi:hypothetical protein
MEVAESVVGVEGSQASVDTVPETPDHEEL